MSPSGISILEKAYGIWSLKLLKSNANTNFYMFHPRSHMVNMTMIVGHPMIHPLWRHSPFGEVYRHNHGLHPKKYILAVVPGFMDKRTIWAQITQQDADV
jgi:hypothetical protein